MISGWFLVTQSIPILKDALELHFKLFLQHDSTKLRNHQNWINGKKSNHERKNNFIGVIFQFSFISDKFSSWGVLLKSLIFDAIHFLSFDFYLFSNFYFIFIWSCQRFNLNWIFCVHFYPISNICIIQQRKYYLTTKQK